ncbi:MAG: ATP-binding protein [Dermatophilaceae bacterium]
MLSEVVVGLVLVLAGLATAGAGTRVVGLLMAATGLTWWAGFLGDASLFWYRGPLVHLLLSYPAGRLRSRFARVVVVAAYVLALLAPLDRNDQVTIAFSMVVLAACGDAFFEARGPERRGRRTAFFCALTALGVLAIGAVFRLRTAAVEPTITWGLDLAMVLVALVLAADLRWGRWSRAVLTGLALDLGVRWGSQPLADRLARALGDPTLRLLYWLPDRNGYVDDQGKAADLPAVGPDRAVTMLEHRGRRVGAMVHDPVTADDTELVESAAALAWMALANVQMQTEVQTRVSELEASRRRIVGAVDAERRRLDEQLQDGAQGHLARLADLLAVAPLQDPAVSEQLSAAQSALHEFAVGMYPRLLTDRGLGPALEELVRGYPIPLELQVDVDDIPTPVAVAAYFVCAESLSNVGKYARAERVHVEVTTEAGILVLRVTDDGVGGAQVDGGSGLRGLRDRVEALCGALSVDSPTGEGTTVQVTIPMV